MRQIGNRRLMAVLLAAAMITLTLASPVMVQTANADEDGIGEGTFVDTLFTDSGEDGDTGLLTRDRAMGFASGLVERYSPLSSSDKSDVGQYAEGVQTTFNANNATLEEYANARTDATTDYDTVRLKLQDKSGNREYLFVVSDVNTTTANYTNTRVMNSSEFKNMDHAREIDETYRLSPFASRNAAEELDRFITEFAAEDEDLTDSYLAKMFGKYGGEISGTDLPGANQ